ncbi:hypothetical protein [Clostridium perfringens]|uniref:hypothetical protein n=1 Tax=Clostridium perfringens TaxID=1502 RepID=UPI00123F0EFA|nr:hypothetical protein [Clostridium perfringens]MDK0911540.1 hypothetical protein [Clostridium perfringens]MDM0752331.1 hypothetical protein [Clostridium perfringens]MDM0907067.1 hypothetical protein [Clostridium perfringens]MDM0947552.1 hypothetical protein [Clostridium perfringens]
MSKKRISREISPNFEDAHHFCWECKNEILEDMPYKMVKCPECGSNIHVCATYNDWNYFLEKKYVYEIEKGDLILMRSDMKSHEVLNIEEDDEIYKVALKGYGVLKLEGNDFVECIVGTWDESKAPWKKNE